MKRLLLSLLALSIPAAHATNYVECEAIRAVISRTEMQIKDVKKKSPHNFAEFKVNQKYPENNFVKYKTTGFFLGYMKRVIMISLEII